MEKLKLFLPSFVGKNCAFALEKEVEITARAVEPEQAFWEVNSLLSYLHKHHHYLSRLDPTLITSGPHFFFPLCKKREPGRIRKLEDGNDDFDPILLTADLKQSFSLKRNGRLGPNPTFSRLKKSSWG